MLRPIHSYRQVCCTIHTYAGKQWCWLKLYNAHNSVVQRQKRSTEFLIRNTEIKENVLHICLVNGKKIYLIQFMGIARLKTN